MPNARARISLERLNTVRIVRLVWRDTNWYTPPFDESLQR